MNLQKDKLIYYGGFPLAVLGLCIFSYYLGYHRGTNQLEEEELALVSQELTVLDQVEEMKRNAPDDLTFYKKLKEEKKVEDSKALDVPKETPSAKVAKIPEKKVIAKWSKKLVLDPKHWVQVGSFLDIGRAHELVDLLKNEGFPASTRNRQTNSGELHRVYVGPYLNKTKADAMIDTLVARGFTRGFVTK